MAGTGKGDSQRRIGLTLLSPFYLHPAYIVLRAWDTAPQRALLSLYTLLRIVSWPKELFRAFLCM